MCKFVISDIAAGLSRIVGLVSIASLTVLAGCSMVPTIQGSGVSKTETRNVTEFDRLEISIPVQIEITRGDTWTFTLTMDDNLLEHVSTTVENGRLKVSSDKNLKKKSPAKLAITAPVLRAVSLAGSVDGTIEELTGELAELDLAGSSEITVGVQAEKFEVDIAGAGSVTATGTSKAIDVSIAGSGTIHAEAIEAAQVSVDVAGSGEVFVHATETLDVSIAGSGTVKYSGDPKVKQSVAGSGEISQLK